MDESRGFLFLVPVVPTKYLMGLTPEKWKESKPRYHASHTQQGRGAKGISPRWMLQDGSQHGPPEMSEKRGQGHTCTWPPLTD